MINIEKVKDEDFCLINTDEKDIQSLLELYNGLTEWFLTLFDRVACTEDDRVILYESLKDVVAKTLEVHVIEEVESED